MEIPEEQLFSTRSGKKPKAPQPTVDFEYFATGLVYGIRTVEPVVFEASKSSWACFASARA